MTDRGLVHKTAVCIIPPEGEWSQIQDIRSKHDRAYSRWMPHINMLYPFLPATQFEEASNKLAKKLETIEPFTITFKSFDMFAYSRAIVFLVPESEPVDALVDLQAAMESVFPQCHDLSTKSDSGFHPHLTVGQFSKFTAERKKNELTENLEPITFTVKEVYMISRSGSAPFSISKSIALGKPGSGVRVDASSEQGKGVSESRRDRPDGVLGTVVSRLEKWIATRNRRDHLPKTKDKLRKAIEPMCSAKLQSVVQPWEVIQELQKDGYIAIETEGGERAVKYLKKKAVEDSYYKSSYTSSYSYHRKSDKQIIMERCKEWVQQPLNCPRSEATLTNSIKQLCVKKEKLHPDDVVKVLEDCGIIQVDYDTQEVTFH